MPELAVGLRFGSGSVYNEVSCDDPEAKNVESKEVGRPSQPLSLGFVCHSVVRTVRDVRTLSHPVARSLAGSSLLHWVGMSKNGGGVSTIVSNPDDADCNDKTVLLFLEREAARRIITTSQVS
jgi:hypothetical protein